MTKESLRAFIELVSPELIAKAISLESAGIDEYVWKWSDALDVIKILTGKSRFVLGGDVYSFVDGQYRATGDGWYANKNGYIATDTEIQRSGTSSIDYINKYIQRNGEGFYFSLVIDFT